MRRGWAWALPLWLATACGGPYHPVTAADVTLAAERFPGSSRATLESGRHLLLSHCARCHRPFEPTDFRASAWPGLVHDMAKHAGLDPDQERLVMRFLMTAAEASNAAR